MADSASSTIIIDADPATIMGVIADFERYPQWADLIRSAEILETGSDGRPASVRFVLDAGVVKDQYTLAYTWSGDTGVRWHLVEGGGQKSQDGSYTLQPVGGSTRVDYTIAVELKMPVLGMFKRRAEKVIMDTALKGLKKRVES